jgi:hypothetical protein
MLGKGKSEKGDLFFPSRRSAMKSLELSHVVWGVVTGFLFLPGLLTVCRMFVWCGGVAA